MVSLIYNRSALNEMTPRIENAARKKRLPLVELTLVSHLVKLIAKLRIIGPNPAVRARSMMI